MFSSFPFVFIFVSPPVGPAIIGVDLTEHLGWFEDNFFGGGAERLIGKSYRQWAPDDVSLSTYQLCSPTDVIFPIFVSRIKFYCFRTSRFPAFFYRTAMIESIFRHFFKVKIADYQLDVDRFRQANKNIL